MPKTTDGREWSIESSEVVYQGFYTIELLHLKHQLFDGTMSRVFTREKLQRGNVCAVLLHDPVRDEVLLVEQFRHGAVEADSGPWLFEVVAGMIEDGETPLDVAAREAFEEAGVHIRNPRLVQQYLASPAATTEEVFIYYAECDLERAGGHFGMAEEDEDIRAHVMSAESALEALQSRRVRNAISVIALQWFRLWRGGLEHLPEPLALPEV